MAREVLYVISDDLDGSPDAKTVEFGQDTVSYSIDLASKNEKALRTALAPYLEVATKVRAVGRGAKSRATVSNRDRNSTIREWALASAVQLPGRGRIAGTVANAFDTGDVDALFAAVGLGREPQKPRRRRKASEPEFSSAARTRRAKQTGTDQPT
jgi:hypothetical protein